MTIFLSRLKHPSIHTLQNRYHSFTHFPTRYPRKLPWTKTLLVATTLFGTIHLANMQKNKQPQLNRPKEGNNLEPRQAKGNELKIAFLNFKSAWCDRNHRNKNHPHIQWENRKTPVTQLIQKDNPHILGFCELNWRQITDLTTLLTQYTPVGYLADNPPLCLKTFDPTIQDSIEKTEFIGAFLKTDRITLISKQAHRLTPGKHYERILVELTLEDKKTKKIFTVLISHFDHQLLSSKQKSGQQEIKKLKDLEKKGPWFSLGDRNWFLDEQGENLYQEYIKNNFISDFRDNPKEGHFGPSGSFAGHANDPYKAPTEKTTNSQQKIAAKMLDVCFKSKKQAKTHLSYAYTGEFKPETNTLLPNHIQGNLNQRNLCSDHYLIGGIFTLN